MGKKKNTSGEARISPLFLEHVKMSSFGKFSNIIVGPFSPGLNVVYGPNEAGKTTLNELVKGVLFGWPSSRGQGNSYRPESAERVGSLFFRDSSNGEVSEVKRAKNSEGITVPTGLLADIDQETYNTIFALTSDELLRLDRHNEVTAHLLTAGSGTGSSPAHALDEVFAERAKAADSKIQFASQRKVKLGLALALTLLMAFAGSFVLYSSPDHGGVSYLIAGVALVAFALVIGAAGVSIALKPIPGEDELDEELKKRDWVVQQDKKTVEACERSLRDFDVQVVSFLEANGLKAAAGSLRRARRLLDQLDDYRTSCATENLNHQARFLQCASIRKELAECKNQRVELCRKAGFDDGASLEAISQAIERKEQDRAKTAAAAAETDRQYGELSERLAAARSSTDFDEAKFKCEEVEARLRETYRRLSVLFIAKRSLEAAIAEWERKSQPEVYRTASRLLSQMTDGAWRQVRMNAQGELEVIDAVKTVRPPHLLSLGTRQQLYLSLRIALLLSAVNVGRGLPVLCDDILVNFDDERRAQAARALAELARYRQVILFTCHSDVAALMGTVDPRSNLIQL